MTRQQANRILDRARAGAQITTAKITEALIATGDLGDPDEEEADDMPLNQIVREPGDWELDHIQHMAPATWLCGLA